MMNKRLKEGLCLAAAGMALLSGCAERGDAYYRPINPATYPVADGPGEKLAPGEVDAAARVAAIIYAHLERMYANVPVRRDAHPKPHGCVAATFTVGDGVPASLRQGLFANPGAYRAVIRYSNSNENPNRPDYDKDGRGMAVKVLGSSERPLPGTPLAVAPGAEPSQDFIMINFPTFLVAEPKDYEKLVGYNDSPSKLTQWLLPVLVPLSIGLKGTINAVEATSSLIDNPLNTRYWSMVPYQLGSGADAVAVKYSAMPCEPKPVVIPKTKDPNYLRAAMVEQLATGGACMRFMVQVRTGDMSVEDPRYEWLETEAPFQEVARIEIPQQDFNTEPQNAACEASSYNPWHALPDHKPLGGVNRMRKAIYERIFDLRRETAGR
ncbi:catalase family protein [Niveispirillum cyanobacteriorum]|uniref:Catalase n=2 Tax=Niveispirillum cyanobacteriorum TaxID=1612173 RepID=A0A2K9N9C3_9PROT|nr:catalase family protein [Niveispirillum cyanobacteriorum]AUN29740.1 catalase [Niveispirillum cyanobacteriorum]GGE61228.1 catalase [Niveispirillum cyanobacteriorum]